MGYFSSGSEGDDYAQRYCSRCVHQKPDDGGCAVWLAHMLHNYEECNKPDSILHLLIPRKPDTFNAECAMFYEAPGLGNERGLS